MAKLVSYRNKAQSDCLGAHREVINQYEQAGSGVGYYHSPQCNNVASHQDR